MAKNDRKKHEPRHVRLYHTMMETAAWLDLSGNAVKLLMLLAKYDNGRNNGDIFMSCRKAADETGLSKPTVVSAFRELREHGFLEATELGHFDRKTRSATSYRLTWLPVPNRRAPTNDFKDWQPTSKKHRANSFTRTGQDSLPVKENPKATGQNSLPVANGKPPILKIATGKESCPQTVCHRDAGNGGPAHQPEAHEIEGENPRGENRAVSCTPNTGGIY